MKTFRITQRSTAAFSLVEVTLALGVAGFCLIAILGLLPAGLNTNQNSVRQTTANGILSTIVADLRATPATSTNSNLFQISMSSSTPTTLCCDANGACSTSSGGWGGGDNDTGGGGSGGSGSQCANAIFKATVTFLRTQGGDDGEEGSGGTGTESFDVKITWPYSAAGGGGSDNDSGIGGDNDSQGGGSSSTPGSIVETFVALDRVSGSIGGGGDDH
jgi:Tfp pilus assembly protein PilV